MVKVTSSHTHICAYIHTHKVRRKTIGKTGEQAIIIKKMVDLQKKNLNISSVTKYSVYLYIMPLQMLQGEEQYSRKLENISFSYIVYIMQPAWQVQ